MRHFKQMLRKADNAYVRDFKLDKEKVQGCGPRLRAALGQVSALLAAEAAAA